MIEAAGRRPRRPEDTAVRVRPATLYPRSAHAMIEWARCVLSIERFPLHLGMLTGTPEYFEEDDGPCLRTTLGFAGLSEVAVWSLRGELRLDEDLRPAVWLELNCALTRLLERIGLGESERIRIARELFIRLEE